MAAWGSAATNQDIQRSGAGASEASLAAGGAPSNDPFMNHKRTVGRPDDAAYRQSRSQSKGIPAGGRSTLQLLCGPPLAIFLFIAVMFTFFLQLPIVPVIAIIVGFSLSAQFGLPNRPGAEDAAWLQCAACCVSVVWGATLGTYLHEVFMRSFYAVASQREYRNVLASSPAAAYGDAGVVEFADASFLDTSRALGYKDGPTYCVAPVVDGSAPAYTTNVGFWAVGLDCCPSRGGFDCATVRNGDAHGGVRVPRGGIFEERHSKFRLAIKQAEAAYNIVSDDDPIIITWLPDPEAVKWTSLARALAGLLIGGVFLSLLIVIMSVSVSGSHADSVLPGA